MSGTTIFLLSLLSGHLTMKINVVLQLGTHAMAMIIHLLPLPQEVYVTLDSEISDPCLHLPTSPPLDYWNHPTPHSSHDAVDYRHDYTGLPPPHFHLLCYDRSLS